jgi:hypothetical protein
MSVFAMSIAVLIGGLLGNTVIAGDAGKTPATCNEVVTCGSEACCSHCGCRCACDRYCKIVCEMKDVKKTVWVVHCSEFCTTLPCGPFCAAQGPCGSGDQCNSSETCATCRACGGKCDVCADLEKRNYVPPKCGKIREKKTLEKKEVVCKVPSYKCVVEYCCSRCGQTMSECNQATPPKSVAPTPVSATPVPAAPAPKADELQAPLPPSAVINAKP